MISENLHAVIVSKGAASTPEKAKVLARRYSDIVRTPKKLKGGFKFTRRPSADFKVRSFKAFEPHGKPGVILVYGDLKIKSNPGNQLHLKWSGGTHEDKLMQEWDFWMEFCPKIKRAKNANDLRGMIQILESRGFHSALIDGYAVEAIAQRARELSLTTIGYGMDKDQRIYDLLKAKRIDNPSRIKNKSTSRPVKKAPKSPKVQILKDVRVMPDPGPCAWLGSIVEWAWVPKKGEKISLLDDKGNALWEPHEEWMFMWSPKYKAVVSIKRPKDMYRMAKVSRYGGAAKMFEVFMARPAENTFELKIPEVKMHELGNRAAHIV